jgi:hypothetical protein
MGLSTRKCMTYGDVVVMDISRNLLLIMSNAEHVTQNNEVRCLSYGKYSARCRRGSIFILNGFSDLREIRCKLFILSILGTRLQELTAFFF